MKKTHLARCGVRTHAIFRLQELKSCALDHSANLASCLKEATMCSWGCSSVVERSIRIRDAPGSIPGVSTKNFQTKYGLVRELNPGPLAPEARIIPLDQRASGRIQTSCQVSLEFLSHSLIGVLMIPAPDENSVGKLQMTHATMLFRLLTKCLA